MKRGLAGNSGDALLTKSGTEDREPPLIGRIEYRELYCYRLRTGSERATQLQRIRQGSVEERVIIPDAITIH